MRTRKLLSPLLLIASFAFVPGALAEQPSRDIDVADTDSPAGLEALPVEWKRIETSRSGAMLAAVAKPRGMGPWPTLVIVHGSHGFAREYVHLAREIASQGFLVVAACWFHGSGEPGNPAVSAPIDCPDAIDMPPGPSEPARNAVADLVTAVRSLPDVRPDLIAIFGHSLGGGATANYLVHGGPAGAAILESSAYDDSYIADARHVRARVLVLQGLDDSTAESTPDGAKRFIEALRAAKLKPDSHFYKHGTHDGLFTDREQHDDTVRRIVAFLRKNLPS
jgi:dienelactone hydrolase